MKSIKLEIRPKEGFGEINFTATDQEVIARMGEPDDTEVVDDEEDAPSVLLWDYEQPRVYFFFEGESVSRLTACETDNPEARLFGKKVFDMSRQEISALMKSHDFVNQETDYEDGGEVRVSFDDALVDFYFKNDRLVSVNWGVVINEKGDVEWYD